MILTVDIGNTNIVLGGFEGSEPEFVARIATNSSKTVDEYATKIRSVLVLHEIQKDKIEGAIVSSVVPPLTKIISDAIFLVYQIRPLCVGPGIKTGINILCDDPSTVGSDIICACVAASSIYGPGCLIIDMGTATKMTVLDKSKAFIGVSIIPGVEIALKALALGTAQLPQISLEAPPAVVGKNTADCMKSGVIYGNASMIDGMIDRIIREVGYDLKLIATGGYASTVIKHCKNEIMLDSDLILKGLKLLYDRNTK